QRFVRAGGAVIIGHSAGGWGALALAGEDPSLVSAIIAFSPGRGGHADDTPGRICAPQALLAAAATFGRGARMPVTWLVAANDSYFPADFSRQLADAFRKGGGEADFHELAAVGQEGHWLVETAAGVALAGPELAGALKAKHPPVMRTR
ncbi:alpha/beta hydrolase family protein, partial [Bradyrhizobium sp.]|uniref:alpha/beta hydrolase family protein n=1 Tax=Bradyrhizobium sp. TaxID=376 RepID=UPI003C6950B1